MALRNNLKATLRRELNSLRSRSKNLAALGTLVVVCGTGCSAWRSGNQGSPSDGWSIKKLWKTEYQQPQSLVAVWSPDVLAMPGKPATRGFGGRLYFYNEKSQAIPVEGELMVHGYKNELGDNSTEKVEADKTFGFTAEQLTSHYSPSDMGASYSVWIPWDAAGGHRLEVTLIPSFKSKVGQLVQGTPAKLYLPGKAVNNGLASKESAGSLLMKLSDGSKMPKPRVTESSTGSMKTTTITVPDQSTIARATRAQTFSLGQSSPAITPDYVGSGVSVGGSRSMGLASSADLPTVYNSAFEDIAPPSQIPAFSTLPALPQLQKTNASTQGGIVQPASFTAPGN